MTNEMSILKEFAVVSSLRLEWRDISDAILGQVSNTEFVSQYQLMDTHVEAVFQLLMAPLAPLFSIKSESDFNAHFDEIAEHYQQNFLVAAGKPRYDADAAYEAFIPIQQSKEFGTGYPFLKQAFDRLDFVIDKYITNDSWLLMSIDTIFKRLSRWLQEMEKLKKADSEDAWRIFRGITESMGRFAGIIGDH